MIRSFAIRLALLVFTVTPASLYAQGDVEKARDYLAEVRQHLLNSFIERENLTMAGLDRTAIDAMRSALDLPDFAGLDSDLRKDLQEALKGQKRLEFALNSAAATAAASEQDVDFVLWADHAARAMVKETGDPYSRILTDEDMTKLMKALQGKGREDSVGLAAWRKDGKVLVAYVQFGYPAYDEGIEIGDEIVSIGGEPVDALSPEAINERLRAKAGQSVHLDVRRTGIDTELSFTLTQNARPPEDVYYELLPDGVGYIRLTMFDFGATRKIRRALESMESDGMRGCILDVRHNPGGTIPACASIADLFLDQGLRVAATVSNYKPTFAGFALPGMDDATQLTTRRKSGFEGLPLVVLINGASASASEMLAGALQDHNRATLIGETTYGKGVGQTPIPLNSMMMKRFLYLSILRYTTPDGREVHHKGIVPDIARPTPPTDPELFLKTWTLRASGALEAYIVRESEAGESTLKELAEYDGFDSARYPGFEEWYQSLKIGMDRDAVRSELRRSLRRHFARQKSETFVCDPQGDVQLQQAVVTLLDQMN